MARSKSPFFVIFSMTLVGALVGALIRFAYSALVIAQAGESMGSVPAKLLLVDVMELHLYALYGAVGGALFGVVLVVVDVLRYSGREDELSWKVREEYKPFTEDHVKARRMEMGDQFLKERESKQREGGT
jgi:hypothetical protein